MVVCRRLFRWTRVVMLTAARRASEVVEVRDGERPTCCAKVPCAATGGLGGLIGGSRSLPITTAWRGTGDYVLLSAGIDRTHRPGRRAGAAGARPLV